MTELLLGCGFSRAKLLGLPGEPREWKDLVTLDINRRVAPDLLIDINETGGNLWRGDSMTDRGRAAMDLDAPDYAMGAIRESYFDEVHAYEVLEHLGSQGDAAAFFNCFTNIHRILRPSGHLFATCPSRFSPWLWGDPSHRRVICAESLAFMSQDVIARNRKAGTAMSDFSDLWTRDFKVVSMQDNHERFMFCLQAIK